MLGMGNMAKSLWKNIEWNFFCADDKYTMDIYLLSDQPRVEG